MTARALLRIQPSLEQQAILATPLQPMRIVAGAGTGKTTTIALLVRELVTERGVAPEEILGLTFTQKAAAELADRIRTVSAGVGPGRECEVHTYHGFAAQLLLLAVLSVTVGLGTWGWVAGVAYGIALCGLLAAGLQRAGMTRLGWANSVTFGRAILTGGVTAMVLTPDSPVALRYRAAAWCGFSP